MDTMDSTPLAVAVAPSASTDLLADERWVRWTQKGRDHDRLMHERWVGVATIAIIGTLLTAAIVLGLQ